MRGQARKRSCEATAGIGDHITPSTVRAARIAAAETLELAQSVKHSPSDWEDPGSNPDTQDNVRAEHGGLHL